MSLAQGARRRITMGFHSHRGGSFSAMAVVLLAGVAQAQWVGPTGAGNRIDYTSGNVFVGNAAFFNSAVRSDVVDDGSNGRVISFHAFAGTPANGVRTTAIWGETNNPVGRALQGFNFATTGNGTGIWAESASVNGAGIFAQATSTSGLCHGGYFYNASTSGVGVAAVAGAATGTPYGLYASCSSSSGYSGFFLGGRNYFEGNVGIGDSNPAYPLTVAGGSSGFVVRASNSSTNNGSSIGTQGALAGVVTPTSPGGFSAGVWGINNGTSGIGIGIAGYQAGSGFGVFGNVQDQVNGFAGYFQGKVNVTGTLSKGGGSFKIDHPLDPENKYLFHSFVESPDMMNIYNGTITTDTEGYATITMPAWFDALNRDFRYQLTVVDESDSNWTMAKVVRKLKDNTFTIRTSSPNTEVSWQVTGIRHDAFANQNRIPVEVEKESYNKGLYLHPTAFGKPETQRVDYQHGTGVTQDTTPAMAPHVVPPKEMFRNEPPLKPAIYGER